MTDRIEVSDAERASLVGLWTTLVEIVADGEPSPYRDLCAEWAAALAAKFEFEPPLTGWITVSWDDDDEGEDEEGS